MQKRIQRTKYQDWVENRHGPGGINVAFVNLLYPVPLDIEKC